MPITGPNGERVYAQMDGGGQSKATSARQLRELFKGPGERSEGLGGKPLLGEPIEKLMERIEQERLEQAIKVRGNLNVGEQKGARSSHRGPQDKSIELRDATKKRLASCKIWLMATLGLFSSQNIMLVK